MIVHVRMFAALRQAAGADHVDVELPDGATVGDLRRRLAEEFPELSKWTGLVMFAISAQYANDGAVVPPGADVACIPPVSGG